MIAVAAMLAAESARRETYVKTLVAVAITLLLYWLARAYSEFTGDRLGSGEPFSFAGLARAARHETPILIGAAAPVLVLLIWWIAGAGLGSAVVAAVWAAAAMIVLIEIVLGVRSHLSGRELAVQTGFGVLLGLLVVALRVLLAH
jgi:hypothetical protein